MKYLPLLLIYFSGHAQMRFTQKDFDNSRIHPQKFHLWYHEYMNLEKTDTTAHLVDDTNYKGKLNYGLSFEHKDRRKVTVSETFAMHGIRISISELTFNKKDSIATISGIVRGGWKDPKQPFKNQTHIFVGTLKDSIHQLKYDPEPEISAGYLIGYRHREISAPVVLDTFPSKKIRHHYRTVSAGGEDRTFYLQTKIRKGDVLAFGQFSTYAEVFDIGNLVYDRQKTKSGNLPDAKIPEPIPIVLRNVQVKYDTIPKPVSSRYFSLTDKAQQAILKNQFAKAATIYDSLNTEFRYIFARDMHNALRANALSRRYFPAIKWAEKLAEKGMKPEYFTPRIFDKLRNSTEWNAFLKRYPEHFEKSKAAFDIGYAKQLEAIVDFDQSEYIRNSKGESNPEKLAETTQEANRRFIEFVEKDGFPTEEKIGVAMQNDSIISRSQRFQVLIYHSQQVRTDTREKVLALRNESAENGIYDAERDNLETLVNIDPCYVVYRGKLYKSKTCFGTDEAQVRKIAFTFTNKHGFLIDSGQFATLAHDPSDTETSDQNVAQDFDYITTLTDDELWYDH